MPGDPKLLLLLRAQRTMRWNQRELAEGMETSQRTLARIQSNQSALYPQALMTLGVKVHPADRDLAAEILAHAGHTLVSAGLEEAPVVVAPPPPPAPVVVPPPPPPRPSTLRDLVDAIVCSVADAADVAPKVVRPAVLLTLRRVLEVGIDLEAAAKAGVLAASSETVERP